MEKDTVKKQEKELSVGQICNTLKPHSYIKKFIEKKYKGKKFSLSEWKKNLKEDGLSF
jgi:hypothetical protein